MPHEGHDGQEDPLTELRDRMSDGLARRRMTKTQLAARSGLGRTTVQEAFRPGGMVPSADTVVALARVLGLPDAELLDLRREAAGEAGPVPGRGEGPGRPIREWDPHDLDVHPSEAATGALSVRALSGYVPRAHDQVMTEVVRDAGEGRSRLLVLVGSSSTGKTRACWEAVQPLADQGWHLWHPYDPTRAEAALAHLERVTPRTVVWLNEAQHYLGDAQLGERIAAALHTLLTHPGRGPVLILGTLWPEYANSYAALPDPGAPDPYSQVRQLLAGRTLTVPDTFDPVALRTATALARGGDRLLADALTRTHTDGRLAQDLAGAPELLRRYEHGSPAVRALLEAAMDARRLGTGLRLPQTFLTDAAADYLTDHDWDHLAENWAEAAFADLARPVHGKQAPLRRSAVRPPRRPPGQPAPDATSGPGTGPVFRLADYLEQHGRTTRNRLCPPASFWHAAHTHLTAPNDLNSLSAAAKHRYRLQWAHHLWHRAADLGDTAALVDLADKQTRAGDREGAERLYRRAADAGHTRALVVLAGMREKAGDREGAEAFSRLAVDADETSALVGLARMREEAGDREGAERLYRRAADAGHTDALIELAWMREKAGDREGAKTLCLRAADAGGNVSLWVRLRDRADREGAETLAQRAADAGHTRALRDLAQMRVEDGDQESGEALARRALKAGDSAALVDLAWMREKAGDRANAEHLYGLAINCGETRALVLLARMRERAGDREGADDLAWQAADAGRTDSLVDLARARNRAGDREGADTLAWRAADAGHQDALSYLISDRWVQAEDWEDAESFCQRAADLGVTTALSCLAKMREKAGDQQGAEAFYQRAVDAGDPYGLTYGLTTLARIREEAGDREGAEALALRHTDPNRRTSALSTLARIREEAGDREGSERLYRQAADAGHTPLTMTSAPTWVREEWPYGLDPDGSPTSPWQ